MDLSTSTRRFIQE